MSKYLRYKRHTLSFVKRYYTIRRKIVQNEVFKNTRSKMSNQTNDTPLLLCCCFYLPFRAQYIIFAQ